MPAAGSWITSLNCGCISSTMHIDQHTRRKILARPGFLLAGILLQQPFVQIAQAFLLGGIPVDLVNRRHQRGQRRRLFDEGGGIGKDFLRNARTVTAQMHQHHLVEIQTVGRGHGLQIVPAITLRQLVLRAGFLRHLQKQQISQLGDVLVIGDAVVAQQVAQVPELGNDVGGEGGQEVGSQ